MTLTDGLIGKQWLVIKAENLGDIVKIWMLDSKSPEGVIHSVIEIRYSDLDSPIVLIVELHMPVYPDWAHMMSALQQLFIVSLWSVSPHRFEKFRFTPACHVNVRK